MAEWQTRRPQKPLSEKVCGFESHSGHTVSRPFTTSTGGDDRAATHASRPDVTHDTASSVKNSSRQRQHCYVRAVTSSAETVVALFPGQGSISSSAGSPWQHSPGWHVVDDVSRVTGVDVAELLLHRDSDELVRTDRAQIATFALSLVGWHELLAHDAPPRYLAGHSLGEFSALVAGGVLSLEDGARLVAARGEAMREASSSRPGGMVALMGGDDGAEGRLSELSDVWVANINGPGQIVVSGTTAAMEDLLVTARARGWRRATALSVGGAFHSPLMESALPELQRVLDAVTFRDTDFLIASNVDGEWRHGGDVWRELLARQLTSPVQFLRAIESLPDSVTSGVELPPAGTLVGLTKRIREFDELSALATPQV